MVAEERDDNNKALYLHIQNAVDHWTDNHQICEQIDTSKQCVQQNGVQGKKNMYRTRRLTKHY